MRQLEGMPPVGSERKCDQLTVSARCGCGCARHSARHEQLGDWCSALGRRSSLCWHRYTSMPHRRQIAESTIPSDRAPNIANTKTLSWIAPKIRAPLLIALREARRESHGTEGNGDLSLIARATSRFASLIHTEEPTLRRAPSVNVVKTEGASLQAPRGR